jgi:PAS domain S-box-containing protein
MLWLYLLGLLTVLIIVLRRVLRRQAPLNDELYSKRVAIEHVQSGVAWIRADGTFGSVNRSFAETVRCSPENLAGQEWYKMFPPEEHHRAGEAYRQMLLSGVHCFDGPGRRMDGSPVWLNVKLVAAYDRKARLVGHHCLIEDKTRERELEQRILLMSAAPEAERRRAGSAVSA